MQRLTGESATGAAPSSQPDFPQKDKANAEKRIARRITYIRGQGAKPPKSNAAYIFGTQTGLVGLSARGAEALHRLLGELEELLGVAKRVPRSLMTNEIHKEIDQLLSKPRPRIKEDSAAASVRLVSVLSNYPVEQVIVNLPLWGLQLFPHTFEFEVGPVTFYELASRKSVVWHVGLEGREMLRNADHPAGPPGGSSHWAKVSLIGSTRDTTELAKEAERRIKQALALIVLFIQSLTDNDLRKRTYVAKLPRPGTVSVDQYIRVRYVIEAKGKPSASTSIRAQTTTMEIRQTDIEDLNRDGFEDCCRALLGANEVEIAIQRSLELFGDGLLVLEPNRMFAAHVTCLEMMLMESYERGLVSKLASRIACLVEPNVSNRSEIIDSVKSLYGVRSSIVHQGLMFEDIENYEWRLIRLMHKIVIRLAQGGFDTFKVLEEYVEKESGRKHFGPRDTIVNWLHRIADRIA